MADAASKPEFGTSVYENDQCAAIADAMVVKYEKMGKSHTAEVAASIAAQIRARKVLMGQPPVEWHRTAGYAGPCPGCGSTTCPGYYKPDGNHLFPF